MSGGRVRGGPLAGERRLGPRKPSTFTGCGSNRSWFSGVLGFRSMRDRTTGGVRVSAPSIRSWWTATSASWPSRAKRTGWRELARFSSASAGIHARLGCSSLKCGLQKSTRRISGRRAKRPSGFAVGRPSEAGTEALLDGRITGHAERKGARYLRLALRAGEARRSEAQAEDSEDDGRRLGAYQHSSLTRSVPERSWSQWSSDGVSTGLRSRSSRVLLVSWWAGWSRLGGAVGTKWGRQRSGRYGKGSSSCQGAVGQILSQCGNTLDRTSFLLSPKLARANTSATGPGSSQRELCGPSDWNPRLDRSCRRSVCKRSSGVGEAAAN